MNEKEHTTENTSSQSFYQTGDIRPPKNYRGIIALLLIAVIVLGSLVSGLSLVNIHLFRQLQTQDEAAAPVRFISGSTDDTGVDGLYTNVCFSSLGLTGSTLSSFDRHYYGLPAGIYITDVAEDSPAAALDICAGDILLKFDGYRVTDIDALQAQLDSCRVGETVALVIYRAGAQHYLDITLE